MNKEFFETLFWSIMFGAAFLGLFALMIYAGIYPALRG